ACCQASALLVLWQVADAEPFEEHAQVRLDGVDAQRELRGDLLVRRRRCLAGLMEGPAEGDQNLALHRRGGRERLHPYGLRRFAAFGIGRLAEDEQRLTEAEPVVVAQALSREHPGSVHE